MDGQNNVPPVSGGNGSDHKSPGLYDEVFTLGPKESRVSSQLAWLIVLLAAGFAFSYVFVANQGLTAAISDSVSSTLALEAVKKKDIIERPEPRDPANRILVKFRNDVSESKKSSIALEHQLKEKENIKQLGIRIYDISEDDTPEEVVTRLKAKERENLIFAEVDEAVAPTYIPNDPLYPSQWQHVNVKTAGAWDMATGEGVVIAVADSGADPDHPDLMAHLVPGWNFYNNNSDTTDLTNHGTYVSGTEAAVGDNNNQVAGVAYNAKIMPLRVSDSSGWGYYSTITSAITYAADHGVKTVNVSFGGICSSAGISSAGSYMKQKGGLVVVSADNTGADSGCSSDSNLVFAAATDGSNNRAGWSTYGNHVDVAAPGVGVLTTANGGGTASVSGTSFSAPMTAGVLALIWSANSSLTPNQATQILFDTALDLGAAGWDPYYGWGLVQADAAVALAKTTSGPPPDTTAPSTPIGLQATSFDSTRVTLLWSASTDNVGVAGYMIRRDGITIGSTQNTTFADTNVQPSTYYTYTVQAYDVAGNYSAESVPASITVPAETVRVTSYSVTNKTTDSATIVYTTNLPSRGTVMYGVSQRKSTNLNMVATDGGIVGTTHTVVLTGLSPATTYGYQISVTSEDNSSSSMSPISTFKTLRSGGGGKGGGKGASR